MLPPPLPAGNLELIERRNELEGKNGATHGWTKFIDLTPGEFAQFFLGSHSGPKKFAQEVALPELGAGESASKDWTGIYTTPVKDQARCGSCWAFSATEQIESDVQRELGEKYELSPQQIVACDTYDNGCGGGNTETAYKYVKESAGIVQESDYPYTSGGGGHARCVEKDLADPVIALKGFKTVGKSSNGKSGVESAMAKYVGSTGPLSICVDASSWQTYKGGVLRRCGHSIDHCVQAVGIDTAQGTWKVRNSWNTDWGEDGFIRCAPTARTPHGRAGLLAATRGSLGRPITSPCRRARSHAAQPRAASWWQSAVRRRRVRPDQRPHVGDRHRRDALARTRGGGRGGHGGGRHPRATPQGGGQPPPHHRRAERAALGIVRRDRPRRAREVTGCVRGRSGQHRARGRTGVPGPELKASAGVDQRGPCEMVRCDTDVATCRGGTCKLRKYSIAVCAR